MLVNFPDNFSIPEISLEGVLKNVAERSTRKYTKVCQVTSEKQVRKHTVVGNLSWEQEHVYIKAKVVVVAALLPL